MDGCMHFLCSGQRECSYEAEGKADMSKYKIEGKRAGYYAIKRNLQQLHGFERTKQIGHISLDRFYVKSQQTWEVRFYELTAVEINGASVDIVQIRFARFADAKRFVLSIGDS